MIAAAPDDRDTLATVVVDIATMVCQAENLASTIGHFAATSNPDIGMVLARFGDIRRSLIEHMLSVEIDKAVLAAFASLVA